jgi:two-component system, NarL family, invasion response regulator UvrY
VPLSSREREVLRLLAKGKSMSEIAALIHVSYKTVATTCAALRTKFSARTPMQLIRIAVEQKIV